MAYCVASCRWLLAALLLVVACCCHYSRLLLTIQFRTIFVVACLFTNRGLHYVLYCTVHGVQLLGSDFGQRNLRERLQSGGKQQRERSTVQTRSKSCSTQEKERFCSWLLLPPFTILRNPFWRQVIIIVITRPVKLLRTREVVAALWVNHIPTILLAG